MRARLTIACLFGAGLLGAAAPAVAQQNPYRLKNASEQTLCVACHSDFAQKLKSPFVHTAVKTGDCSGCHDPHVSSHDKLLATDERELCASCHGSVIPANAKSAHQVVADGQCEKCHDPHASANPANLVAKGADLCFTCHKDLGEAVTKAKFRHAPVAIGCLTCHLAHGSDKAPHLLKTAVPALCVGCHKADGAEFAARHMKYPVAKASCTSCHDPHGSNQPALLLDTVHPPVANRACVQCHEPPDSATPFATKRAGVELCKGCHNDMVTAAMSKPRLHWPIADRMACVNCHSPHASRHEKLLKADIAPLCGTCHPDTMAAIKAVTAKHAPVDGGMCTVCHSPHGANGPFLVDQASVTELCTSCHDYSTHSAHPIGEKAVDPRNKNLRVDCLSCHKAHGTAFNHMLTTATNLELCTQCHKQYGR